MKLIDKRLSPKTIFSGNRDIREAGMWNQTYAFTEYTTVRITYEFQEQYAVMWLRPCNDNIIHTFSSAFYSNDGATRLLFGRIKFKGRYIERAVFKMSHNFGTPQDLGAGHVYIIEIKGFHY